VALGHKVRELKRNRFELWNESESFVYRWWVEKECVTERLNIKWERERWSTEGVKGNKGNVLILRKLRWKERFKILVSSWGSSNYLKSGWNGVYKSVYMRCY
jgi:hypothetical protein